jgi:hypothetical protein
MTKFLFKMKERYPDFYKRKLSPVVAKEEITFDDIYNF